MTRSAPQVGALRGRVDRTCVEIRRACTDVRLTTHMDAGRSASWRSRWSAETSELDQRERVGKRWLLTGRSWPPRSRSRSWRRRAPFSWPSRCCSSPRYAVVARVEFSGGAAYAVPTQIVFVPMLLLLPTPLVPLLVAARPSCRRPSTRSAGGRRSSRSALAVGDAWFAWRRGRAGRARRPDPGVAALAGTTRSRSAPQLLFDGVPTLAALRFLHGSRRCARCCRPPWPTASTRCCPVGLLAALAAADAPAAALLVLAARVPASVVLARARGRMQQVARARPRLPRHRAAAARPARGRRRVHGPPHRGRRRADGVRRRADGPRRGHPPHRRAGRAAARHRQDRRARRDHQQARPAQRRGVGDHEDPHRRGRAHAGPGRRPARRRRPRRARLARALGRRRLPGRPRRRGDPARRLHRLRLRRVQRDDHGPLLPQGAPALRRRRRAPQARRHPVLPCRGRALVALVSKPRPPRPPRELTAAPRPLPRPLRRSRRPRLARPSRPERQRRPGRERGRKWPGVPST